MNELLARIFATTFNGAARFLAWLWAIVKSPFTLLLQLIHVSFVWYLGIRFWPKVAILLGLAGLAVFAYYYSSLKWAQAISSWFRSSDGVEATTLTGLALLGLIYWKFPHLFSYVVGFVFLALLLMFIFERHRTAREGQNHWAVFAIFVLPVLPVLFTLLKYKNLIAHGVSTLLYLALVATFMATNPNSVFQSRLYTQGTIYIVALLIFLALMVVGLNQNVLSEDWSKYLSRLGMLFVTCASLGLAVSLAIKFFGTNPTWSLRYLVMLLILVVAGAIVVSAVWKRLPNKSYFAYFSNANLVLKTAMLLSCWVSDLTALLVAEPLQTWVLLAAEIALVTWYAFAVKAFTKLREGSGGVMLRNEPLELQKETVLPISQNFRYNYAISCWVNLQAQPPSASPAATGFTNLFSYGGRPAVSFNAATNMLRVTMRNPGGKAPQGIPKAVRTLAEFSGESLPAEAFDFSAGPLDVLVVDIPDVALQKWIHLVFFYTSEGMLDIFINGQLYKSVAAIVTQESSGLTVGASHGNTGLIANVMFFQSTKTQDDFALSAGGDAIDAATVLHLYNDFKHRDPPIIRRVFPLGQINPGDGRF